MYDEALRYTPFGVAAVERGHAAQSRSERTATVAVFSIEGCSGDALALELLVNPFVVQVRIISVHANFFE